MFSGDDVVATTSELGLMSCYVSRGGVEVECDR